MTSYYFSAHSARAQELLAYREALRSNAPNSEVTSCWMERTGAQLSSPPENPNSLGRAMENMGDIRRADVFVQFTGPVGLGGRHVEYGYALAYGRRMVIIGDPEHMYHLVPTTEEPGAFPDFQAFLNSLS